MNNLKKHLYEICYANYTKFEMLMRTDDPDIILPEAFLKHPMLRLQVGEFSTGYNEPKEDGVAFSTRFGGIDTECFVPWKVVVAFITQEFEFKLTPEGMNQKSNVTLPGIAPSPKNTESQAYDDGYVLKDTVAKHLKLVVPKK